MGPLGSATASTEAIVGVDADIHEQTNGEVGTNKSSKQRQNEKSGISYGIDDVPPWYLCIFMALQHYLTMIGAIVSIPFILCPALCMKEDDPARGHIISTMIFVTGIVTFLQTTFGCRLPIVQGGTISFLVPTLAILSLPAWKCPSEEFIASLRPDQQKELWQVRMRELSGAIAVSALVQVVIGYFGIIGIILKYVTPLTIAPTVSLVGLSLFENAADAASQHWGISVGTIIMLTVFSQCMQSVSIPGISYKRGQGLTLAWFPLFKLFPIVGVDADIHEQTNGEVGTNKSSKQRQNEKSGISYGIDDVPPWYLCIFMALQHYLTMIGAIVSIPFILCPALCMKEDDPARGHIISTMIFVTGIVTFLQTTFGCRLPIVQGGTISFLVPTLAILSLPAWKCPSEEFIASLRPDQQKELWQVRMRELSGAIAVSALVQVVIGYFGIIGIILKYVTPLTIVPTVSLVGLSLFENAADAASQHWGISVGTIIMLTVFSQCMQSVSIPGISYKRGQGLTLAWFPLFKLFPVLLTILIMWGICGLLTLFNVLEVGHPARTDTKIQILMDSPWFRFPYPGQWGIPTVSAAGVLGMLAGVLACTVESISYYPTTARMCGAPPPPVHAVNRGIGTEGLGTVLAGLWGSGNGTNTFGENVGAIGVTKIGSRRVIQYACVLMLLQGIISKFGAVFIIIPEPVVGGIFCVMFGMIAAFGLSALQYVDLNSSRNLYILGFSIFFPLVLSKWMVKQTNVIQTGSEVADSIFTVLCSTSILVGGFVGCFLDNTIPGTAEERGLIAWQAEMNLSAEGSDSNAPSTYDFPIGMSVLRRWTWTSYLPFSPTYKPRKSKMCSRNKIY